MNNKMIVIFRKERHESDKSKFDIVAIFPELVTSENSYVQAFVPVAAGWTHENGYTITECHLDWYRSTSKATPAEYAPIFEYLKTLEGFDNLIVRQRLTYQMDSNRAMNNLALASQSDNTPLT